MIKKIEDQCTIGNSIQALMDKCKELTDEVNYLSRMNKRYIKAFAKMGKLKREVNK